MHVREREVRRKKKKKAQKIPLRRDQDLNPRTLSPEPGVLSIRPRRPAYSGRDKEGQKINPSSAICETNTEIRAKYVKKNDLIRHCLLETFSFPRASAQAIRY